MEKRPIFPKKKVKKSKLALNLLLKISILKYKGKRARTNASRNLPKLTSGWRRPVPRHLPRARDVGRPRDVAIPRSNFGEWERYVAEFLAVFGKK